MGILRKTEVLKDIMEFLFIFMTIFGISISGTSSEDCKLFKEECKNKCLEVADGVWASECWGKPLYVECKRSDETVFKIPGFTCENSECPIEFNEKTKVTQEETLRQTVNRRPQKST